MTLYSFALLILTLHSVAAQVVEVTVRVTPVAGGAASVLVSNSLPIDGLQFNLVDNDLNVPEAEGDFENLEVLAVGSVSDWNVNGGSNGAILAFAFTATGNIVLPASNEEVQVLQLSGLQSSDETQFCVNNVIATKEGVVFDSTAVYLDVGCDVPGITITPSLVTENGEIDIFVSTSEPMSGFQFNLMTAIGADVEITTVTPGSDLPGSFQLLSSGSTVLAFSTAGDLIPVLTDQLLATVVVADADEDDTICLEEEQFFKNENNLPVQLKSLPFNPCTTESPGELLCDVLGKSWLVPCFFDITEDNIVNVGDILALVDQLLFGPDLNFQVSSSTNQCAVLGKTFTLSCSYDANGDGQINVADVAGNGGLVQALLYECYIGSNSWDPETSSCGLFQG